MITEVKCICPWDDTMIKKQVNIWIWMQGDRILKAISCPEDGTVRIYDEYDNLIMKRTGLNTFQVKQIELNLQKYGAKRLDTQAEPFRFL